MAIYYDVINKVKRIKQPDYEDDILLDWLDTLEAKIKHELYGQSLSDIVKIRELQSPELIAPFPYDEVYELYLYAKIDDLNGEADEYQSSAVRYNYAYERLMKHYTGCVNSDRHELKIFL